MKKRLLSALLAVLMLSSTVTVGVTAEEAEWTEVHESTVVMAEENTGESSEESSEENTGESSEESSEESSGESSEESSEENTGESSEESSEESSGESSEESSEENSGESSEESSGENSGDSSDEDEVITVIDAPVVALSYVKATGKIKLTWKAVEGAKEYKVYRSVSKLSGYELMKTTDKLSYTNTNSVLGKRYYYKVMAVAADGTKSDFSTVISGRVQMAAPEVTTSNVEKTGKIKITWNKVEGAAKYRVYRSTSKNGTYSLMKTVDTGRSFVNENAKTGTRYYYKVKAIPADSNLKEILSDPVSRTCDLPRPVVKASNDKESGKIVLTWEKISGAVKYRVYRADAKDGEYTLMKTVTETTYTNKSAEPDKRYYYKVRAVHKNTNANSGYSAVVSRLCDLSQPQIRAIANAKGKPEVTWEPVDGAVKYQIYRSDTKNGKYKLVYTAKGTRFVNSSAEVGKTYYYKVKAIASNSGANSVLSATDGCQCVKNSYQYTYSSYSTVKYVSEFRDTNLRVACEYIDGTILAPGEEFSFNDVVGPRTESRGFVEGPAIPQPNIGGGICQVSTTIFNVVLYGNLKVTDREQHSIASSYVPIGRDAMIHNKSSDFCFINDSDYYIKISAKADSGYVSIKFLTREKGVSPRDDVSLKVLKTGSKEYFLVRRYKGVPNYYTKTSYD